MDESKIAYCKIFPPLGVARVGDSMDPEGFYFPATTPDGKPRLANGLVAGPDFNYRDATGSILRQAAIFHIYAFDSEHHPLGELLAKKAQIRWSVALANKKAACFNFEGAQGARSAFEGSETPINSKGETLELRNNKVGGVEREPGGPHGHRYVSNQCRKEQLEINCSLRSVSGTQLRHTQEENLRFVGKFQRHHEVYLGEIATDGDGRLIVLGGHGVSAPVDPNGQLMEDPTDAWITDYANNDNWFDDTSDGPVTAEVSLFDSSGQPTRKIPVNGGSWVVVAPPDYAPDTTNIVTLYDTMEEVAHDVPGLSNLTTPAVRTTSNLDLRLDIWPIVERSAGYRWVSKLGLRGHGQGRPGDGLNGNSVSFDGFKIAAKAQDGALKKKLFNALRPPIYTRPNGVKPDEKVLAKAKEAATATFMPPLSGDEGTRSAGKEKTWLSLTHLQYERMSEWANRDDSVGELPAAAPDVVILDDGSIHPSAMTKSLLDRCCGGAFFPGIEVTSIVRDPKLYAEAFRFDHAVLEPGDVTKYMACPWQADFYECMDNWWPAQRPDDVIHEDSFKKIFDEFDADAIAGKLERALGERQLWARGVGDAKPRPSEKFLTGEVTPKFEKDDDTLAAYVEQLANLWQMRLTDAATGESDASPWRKRYLLQEACDRFAGRYFQPVLPDPDAVLKLSVVKTNHKELTRRFGIETFLDLRQCWHDAARLNDDVVTASLNEIGKEYTKRMLEDLHKYLMQCVFNHPFDGGSKNPKRTAQALFRFFQNPETVSGLDRQHAENVLLGSETYHRYVLAELCESMKDAAYLVHAVTNGDNGMVQMWKKLGFVVKREYALPKGKSLIAQVEAGRDKYDGRSYRDYFYYLLNIQDHQDFIPQAIRIADETLAFAQAVIESPEVNNENHPESFVPYEQNTFRAKLEEIYEIHRSKAQNFDIYYAARRRNLSDVVRGMLDNAPFNQCDGAWLRNISAAGPGDDVRALLFEVWSDEIGNGNPLLHHGNLYTNLLASNGIHLPPLNSRAYADEPRLHESAYLNPVFQLAISEHTDRYFPELLGMTLFLEWEVLSLALGIKRDEYLGVDTQFWRMHVGIDNATNGHGAKARDAVISYLDRIRHEGGNAAVDETWARIWRGFVAFESVDSMGFGDDVAVARRRPENPSSRLTEVMTRKANYGALNHFQQRLGKHRINDLFEQPPLFQRVLAASKWIVPGDPDQSLFLKHLLSFDGPMYQIFDKADMDVWRDWIEWLGRDGDTPRVKRYFDKGQAMEALLIQMKSVAEGVAAHARFKIKLPKVGEMTVAEMFSANSMTNLMKALKAPESGWVVLGKPEESPLVADMLRGSTKMGQALDRRFPSINNRIGRQIVIEWIRAACPIPGEPDSAKEGIAPALKPLGRQLLMHTLGMGAVH